MAFSHETIELSKRIEEIYAAHPEALNPTDQEDLEIGRQELLALFNARLGDRYDSVKVELVLKLHRGLQETRLRLGKELQSAHISMEEFLTLFDQQITLTFEKCEEILGKSDFARLFGGSPDEMRNLIDPSIFLGLPGR